jgi:hypothetical protein
MPLEEVPGWALDKTLSAAVMQASLGPAGSPMLSQGHQTEALESEDGKATASPVMGSVGADDRPDDREPVDARVVGVKVVVDEDLAAYNRYLADLNRSDPPKRW